MVVLRWPHGASESQDGIPISDATHVGEEQRLHRLVGALRKLVRPMAAHLQPLQPTRGVALQAFLAGLAADAELLAQLRGRKMLAPSGRPSGLPNCGDKPCGTKILSAASSLWPGLP